MKKIISLVVVFALAVTMLVSTAFAAGTVVYVEDVGAGPGEEVTVDVIISGNTGFGAAKVELVYDSSVLTLKRITTGLLTGGAVNHEKGIVSFASATDVTGDGVLMSAIFAVAADAPDCVASVSVNVGRLANTASEPLNPSVAAGSVSIKAPHTHSYNKVVTAPTCTEKGYTTYTCACGDSYKADEVAALGHKWDKGTVTTQPTEGKPGVRTYKCTVCGETKTEEIPALDHTHKYTSTVTAPTCTEKGYTTYTCACGDSYKADEVAALGHKWDDGTVKAPTCDEKGHTTYKCTTCGETKKEETAALGHKWEKGAVTEPTCDKKGSTAYKCATCGETKTEEIAAVGHKYTKPVFDWAEDYSSCTVSYSCTSCSETITQKVHVTSKTTPATETAKGEIVYTATFTLDGQTYTETKTVELPKLEPDPNTEPGPEPEPGNSSVLYLILALVVAAGIGAVWFFLIWKKKKKEEAPEEKA